MGDTMGDNKKNTEIDVFAQLEDALEERAGNDRRKENRGHDEQGEDRRKSDRRQQG